MVLVAVVGAFGVAALKIVLEEDMSLRVIGLNIRYCVGKLPLKPANRSICAFPFVDARISLKVQKGLSWMSKCGKNCL